MRKRTLIPLAYFSSMTRIAQGPTTNDKDAAIPVETAENSLDSSMQKRFDYSTGTLNGLSMADYSLIETNA